MKASKGAADNSIFDEEDGDDPFFNDDINQREYE